MASKQTSNLVAKNKVLHINKLVALESLDKIVGNAADVLQ
jgi:hypothetical protein